MEIVEKVVVNFESHKDVARIYRVSPNVISMLLHKIKKNPLLLSELIDKRQAQLHRHDLVSDVIEDLNRRDIIIDKVS